MPLISYPDPHFPNQPKQEEDDQWEFTKGFGQGVDQLQAIGGGAWAAAGSLLDNDEMLREGMDYYREQMREAAQYTPDTPMVEALDSVEDFTNFVSYTAGNVIPSLLTMAGVAAGGALVGGPVAAGAGAVATAGTLGSAVARWAAQKGVKGFAQKVLKEQAEGVVKKEAKKRVKHRYVQAAQQKLKGSSLLPHGAKQIGGSIATVGAGTAMSAGENFTRIYEETGLEDPVTAWTTGLASGSLDMFAAPFRAAKRAFPDDPTVLSDLREHLVNHISERPGALRAVLTEAMKSGGWEAGVEALQEFFSRSAVVYADSALPEEEQRVFLESLVSEEAGLQYLHAAVSGFIGGPMISGPTAAVQRRRETKRLSEVEKALGAEIKERGEDAPLGLPGAEGQAERHAEAKEIAVAVNDALEAGKLPLEQDEPGLLGSAKAHAERLQLDQEATPEKEPIVSVNALSPVVQRALIDGGNKGIEVTPAQVQEAVNTLSGFDKEQAVAHVESLLTRQSRQISGREKSRERDVTPYAGDISYQTTVTVRDRFEEINSAAGQERQQVEGDDTFTAQTLGGMVNLVNIMTPASTGPVARVDGEDKPLTPLVGPELSVEQLFDPADTNEYANILLDIFGRGMPTEFMSLIRGTYVFDDTHGYGDDADAAHFPSTRTIGIRAGKLELAKTSESEARRQRWNISHELWHGGDVQNQYTATMPGLALQLEGDSDVLLGDVMAELYDQWESGSALGQRFNYPLNNFLSDLEAARKDPERSVQDVVDTVRKELFAQLGAAFLSNPRELKENAPQAYALIKEIRDNPARQAKEIVSAEENVETREALPESGTVLPEIRSPPVPGGVEIPDTGGAGGVGGVGLDAGTADPDVGESRQDQDRDDLGSPSALESSALDVVRASTTAPSLNEIVERLGAPFEDVQAALDELVFKGDLAEELLGDTAIYSLVAEDPQLVRYEELPAESQAVTASTILYGDEQPQVIDSPTIVKVAEVLDERVAAAYPGKDLLQRTEENAEIVSDLIAHEAIIALDQEGNAGQWYQEKVKNAMEIASRRFPELSTDQNSKFAFTAIMAITSNGASVPENSENTFSLYQQYRETQVFPDFGVGKEAKAMKKSFRLLNAFVEKEGVDFVREYMDSEKTVREIFEDTGYKVNGENQETVLNGSAILGPKVGGGFYQNLNGNFDPLTMDRWFMRTFGRLTGSLMGEAKRKFPAQVAKFRGVALSDAYRNKLRRDGISRVQLRKDDDYLVNYATAVQSAYAAGGFKKKDALNRASNTLKNSQAEKQAPKNGGEREYIRSVMRLALNKVNALHSNQPVDMGALQAIIWYPEKDLYKKMGVGNAKSEPTDYETEFRKIVEGEEGGQGVPGSVGPARESGPRGLEPGDGRADLDPDPGDGAEVLEQPEAPSLIRGKDGSLQVPEDSGDRKAASDFHQEVRRLAAAGEVQEIFTALGDSQRSTPEVAMMEVQRSLGGGVLASAVEGVGDITHRMSEEPTASSRGHTFVLPKVVHALDMLRSPYGFEKEHRENIVNNRADITEVKESLKAYASAHRDLIVYNDLQKAARDAAVALGEENWAEATKSLEVLEASLNAEPDESGEHPWVRDASRVDYINDLNDPRQTIPIGTPQISFKTDLTDDSPSFIEQDEPPPPLNIGEELLAQAEESRTARKFFGRKTLRRVSDQFGDFEIIENALAKRLGLERLPEWLSFRDRENLSGGKQAEALQKIDKDFREPLHQLMANAGLDPDQVGLYLLAKHAPERNRVVRRKENERHARRVRAAQEGYDNNPTPKTAQKLEEAKAAPKRFEHTGSGLSDQQAADVIQDAQDGGKLEQLEKISGVVYRMLSEMRENMVTKGLLDEQGRLDWEQEYNFYVPLKGAEGDTAGLGAAIGTGFNIKGRESFKLKGRITMPFNPLIQAFSDVERKIIRAERNTVAQRFLKLVEKFPDPEAWKVWHLGHMPPSDPPSRDPSMTPAQMRAERVYNRPDLLKYIEVKRGGQSHFIEVFDETLNRTLQNVNPGFADASNEAISKGITLLNQIQNARRTLIINWNPSWGLVNPIRDAATSYMYALSEQEAYGGRLRGKDVAGKMIAGSYKAGKAFWEYSRAEYKNLTPRADQEEMFNYVREFKEDGAQTGQATYRTLEEQQRRMARAVKRLGNSKHKDTKEFFKNVVDNIEIWNQSTENSYRLSAYIEARKAGVARGDAATLAKDLTVNFNRKGEWSSAANTGYLFFNAAIQGNTNMWDTLVRKNSEGQMTKAGKIAVGAKGLAAAKKVAFGAFGLGFVQTMANIMLADDDDDGESLYKDINTHVLNHNFVVMIGDQAYGVPMPYGYGFLHNAGRVLAESVLGLRTVGEGASTLGGAAMRHFSPIELHAAERHAGGIKSTVQRGMGLLPDIAEFFTEQAANINFFGSPIHRENPYKDEPASYSSRRGTLGVFKAITEWLNDIPVISGGSPHTAGRLDLSPDRIQHMFDWVFAGFGRFGTDALDVASKTAGIDADPLRPTDVPILRKFVYDPNEYVDQDTYYENRRELKMEMDLYDASDAADQRRLKAGRSPDYYLKLQDLMKAVDKKLRSNRKQVKQLELQPNTEKVRKRIETIQKENELIFDRFNKRYKKAAS